MRDAVDETAVAIAHALLNERAKATDEVDANLLAGAIERRGDGREVLGCRRSANFGDGRNRDALVDDGDAELALELLCTGHEVLCRRRKPVVDALRHDVDVLVDASAQGES